MTSAKAGASAPDATVSTDATDGQTPDVVAQLERDVEVIAKKIEGMKATLSAKKDELKAARSAARKG